MTRRYPLKDVLDWLDHSQSLLSTVLSFVGEAREPLSHTEIRQVCTTLLVAVNVVNHIARHAADIGPAKTAAHSDREMAPLLPEHVAARFANITDTLVQINTSLESRSARLN